jgi:hypothetical protein
MPSPGLTLGRETLDAGAIDPASPNAIADLCDRVTRLQQMLEGLGWPSAAIASSDTVYQAVYTRNVAGDDVLYGGTPNDPTNPNVLVVSAAGSATVIFQEEGSTVGTRGTLNFIGDTVTAADNGGSSRVDVTIAAFDTVIVSGSSNVVASATANSITLVAGTYIDIVTDAGAASVTISTDLTEATGWSASGTYILGAINGVIQWIPTSAC